jgi:hypothetical protein
MMRRAAQSVGSAQPAACRAVPPPNSLRAAPIGAPLRLRICAAALHVEMPRKPA